MIAERSRVPGVGMVIAPQPGETITVRTDYAPWLLGWCRWSVRRMTGGPNTALVEILASGRWKWRGRRAECSDTLIEGPA